VFLNGYSDVTSVALWLFFFSKQIVFEGIRGPNFEGDIAIDDVSITIGKCKQETTVANAGKTGKLEWRLCQKCIKKQINAVLPIIICVMSEELK